MTVSRLQAKAEPSLADVSAQIAELHDCVHQTNAKVDGVAVEVTKVRERVAHVEGVQKGLALRVGAPTEPLPEGSKPPRRSLGAMSPWKAAAALASSTAAAAGLYKILEPAVVAAAVALHHTLMHR